MIAYRVDDPDDERDTSAQGDGPCLPGGPEAAVTTRSTEVADGAPARAYQDVASLPVTISNFARADDRYPRQERMSWGDLVARLRAHRRRVEKDGPLFSPVSYRQGATRGNAGVDQLYLAVADVDGTGVEGGIPVERFLERFPPDVEVVVVSTHSSSPEHPKYRAVTPLKAPCAANDWPEAWARIQAHVWGGLSDVHTKDQARFFYWPSCPPGAEPFVGRRPGAALDWEALPPVPDAPRGGDQRASDAQRGGTVSQGVLDLDLIRDGVPEGHRDAQLNAYAWHLHAAGWDDDDAERELIAAADRCQPPFDHAEALRKWHRVCAKEGPPVPRIDAVKCGLEEEEGYTEDGGVRVLAKQYHRTDMGNAERLVARFGDDMRYSRDLGTWLVWTGTHWELDRVCVAERLAKRTARAIWDEIRQAETVEDKKAIAGHAARSESSRAVAAMLKLAETEEGIPVRQEQLDTDRWLLAVQNGTLDLRTGDLREHRRGDYITKLVPITYDPRATAPRFERFLDEIMKGRRGLVEYLQRVVGYCLTGVTTERALLIFWGNGANGKSTLLELIADMLGAYATKTPISTLMAKSGDSIPNDIARLRGARFVYASEGEEGKRLAEAQIKEMTGGEKLTARFMRAEFFTFDPQFKLLMGTNHKPDIRGTDQGIWDRVKLIPFEARFDGADANPQLREKLRAELPGILAWAVQGCLAWQRSGLQAPAEVTDAVWTYRAESDSVGRFLGETCVLDAAARVTVAALAGAYEAWCREGGEAVLGPKQFADRLLERGLTRSRGARGVRRWQGVGLLDGQEGVTAVTGVTSLDGEAPDAPLMKDDTDFDVTTVTPVTQGASEAAVDGECLPQSVSTSDIEAQALAAVDQDRGGMPAAEVGASSDRDAALAAPNRGEAEGTLIDDEADGPLGPDDDPL
jgi:P4 family phage/plasmid primase-like protien